MTTPPNHNTADQSGADERAKDAVIAVDKMLADVGDYQDLRQGIVDLVLRLASTQPAPTEPIAMIDPERIDTLYGPIGACAVHATLYQAGMNYNDKATMPLYATPQPFPAPAVQPTSCATSADAEIIFNDADFNSASELWLLIDRWAFASPGDNSSDTADDIDSHIKNLILKYAAIVPQVVQAPNWRGLSDAQWVNLVNHEQAYINYDKDDAVHLAVKLTEIRLRENNAAPIVATVPSEPVAYRITFAGGGREVFSRWPEVPTHIPDAIVTPLYAAPGPTEQESDPYFKKYIATSLEVDRLRALAEQASDVLPKIAKLLEEADEQQRWGGGTDSDGALHNGTVDFEKLRREIAALLSSPAAKGNAQDEVKS